MFSDEIKAATKEDPIIQKLVEVIHSGEWNSFDKSTDLDEDKLAEIKMSAKVQHELTMDDDGSIILRCTNIILPCK